MKLLAVLLVLFMLPLPVLATPRLPSLWSQQYKSLTSKGFGRLSAFWAQEMIGAPEGRIFLATLESRGHELYRAGVGIFEESVSLDAAFLRTKVAPALLAVLEEEVAEYDALLREHADEWHTEEYADIIESWQRRQLGVGGTHVTAVANLLNGAPPVGISRQGIVAAEVSLAYSDDDDGSSYLQLVANAGNSVDIVNMSVMFTSPQEAQEFIRCATTYRGVLFVAAVGNDHPTPMYAVGKDSSLITVGSCAPTGYFSHFSRAGDKLTIAAPSDDDILSIAAGTGEFITFGGTSGAAPLVSGALADVLSFIPDLTSTQAIDMLQATAIATTINTSQKGIGVLNYYKLLRVAERVQRTAAGDPQQIDQLLYDDAMYDFRAEAGKLKDVARTIPELAFFYLRKAFFLDSDDMETRRLLAEMYRQAGHEAEALFYDNPEQSQQHKMVQVFAKYRRLLTDMARVPIYADKGFSEKFLKYIAIALRNPQSPEVLEVLLRRLSLADLKAAQLSGDLAKDLQVDPAELVKEKLHLFNVLKRHQLRLEAVQKKKN